VSSVSMMGSRGPRRRTILLMVLVLIRAHLAVRNRFYIRLPALPPVQQSAWAALYASRDDPSMMTCTGFNTASFHSLHNLLFPVPPNHSGHPPSLDSHAKLGLILHYLNSSMMQKTLCQIFAVTEAIVSRDLNYMLNLLCEKLPTIPDAQIIWPNTNMMKSMSDAISSYHQNNYHIFGFVDGVSFPIGDDSNPLMQNAYYNRWKGLCTVSNLIVYGADGCIIWTRFNCPGSWHDAHLGIPLFRKLLKCPAPYCLVADSAFPAHGPMRGKIRVPAKANTVLDRAQTLYSNQITSLRQACEWGMRGIEGGFSRLKTTLPIDHVKRGLIIKACLHLFNLRTRWTAVNQIRTVYDPRWITNNLYNSDNRRIAKYYRIIQG
jgi:hypothetical protein